MTPEAPPVEKDQDNPATAPLGRGRRDAVVRAFNTWLERYDADPDAYDREIKTLRRLHEEKANGQTPSYGETCVSYLEKLMAEERDTIA